MSGFTYSQDQGSGDSNGKVFNYQVAASHSTLIAAGDVVTLTGTGDTFGNPQVDAAAAGSAITGVVAAVSPNIEGEALTETGLIAGKAGEVQVHMQPMLNFDVNVVNGPLTVAQVSLNADIDATAATKEGGLTVSNMALDAATAASTDTLQFRIVRLLEDANGVLGNRAQVRFNNTTTNAGTTGA